MELERRAVLGAVGGLAFAGSTGVAVYGQVRGEDTSRPSVLVAGSLQSVAERIGGASVEAHGSAGVRQLILDGLREPDAVALADPVLFQGITDRTTLFATNALVIAYNPDSSHADELQRSWSTTLQRSALSIGRTDPAVDPLGYRTVMALRLAQRDGLVDEDRVLANTDVFPETDLLNVLEGGDVDAAFTYRNMAVQRDLPYVSLPPRINFSDPTHEDTYATVSYDLADSTVEGAPIQYAAASMTTAGQSWVDSLVSADDLLTSVGFTVPPSYPRED